MHWISLCISDFFILYLKNSSSLHVEVWDVLAWLNSSNTNAQNIHLTQRLHNVWRGNWSINDHVRVIKQLEEDLACINVNVLGDDFVLVTLNGLGIDYKYLDISIFV